MKRVLPVITALLLLFPSFIFAEDVTFVKEYSYQASEADSKLSARAIALEQVKRLLLEELGTYLISETEVKDFQLTKDKITTLSAGIVMTQILEDKWNGETYYLKAKIKADPKEVTSTLDNLRKNKKKEKELEDSKKRADDALAELAKLKKELDTLKGDKQKQAEYKSAANVLSAKDWFEKGDLLSISEDNQGGVEAYSRAIELDPEYVAAYTNRGGIYNILGDNKRAIADCDRAIELDPKDAFAYLVRGWAYSDLGDQKKAITDYDRVIDLNKDAYNRDAYYNRGLAYETMGDNKMAIADYDKAIAIDPKYTRVYILRGGVYYALGDKKRAIADYNRVIELDPKHKDTYIKRGVAYKDLGDNKRAIADYDRVIELDPKDALAYKHRGHAYNKFGDREKAMSDWKTAARLGNKETQDWLRSQGIEW